MNGRDQVELYSKLLHSDNEDREMTQRKMPDNAGRHELVCPRCTLYMLMPESARKDDLQWQAETEGCPYCGTHMLVRRHDKTE